MHRKSLIAVVAALALVTAACSSGSPGTSTTEASTPVSSTGTGADDASETPTGSDSSSPTAPSETESETAATTPDLSGSVIKVIKGESNDFTDAPYYRAFQILKDQGIDVEIEAVSEAGNALRAVVAGTEDITLLAPTEAITAVANGDAAIKYVTTTQATSDYVLLARPGLSLENLGAATISSGGPGTEGIVIAMAALAAAGIDTSKLQEVTIGGTSARVTALLSGQVDLAPVHADAGIPAVETGQAEILINAGKYLGSYIQQGAIISDEFLKNRDLTQAFVNALLEANEWAINNPDEYLEVAREHELVGDLTPDQQRETWEELIEVGFFSTNGTICPADLENTLKFQYDSEGGIKKDEVPERSAYIDSSFVENYWQQKGMTPAC